MFKRFFKKDSWVAIVTAALGAGVVTSFAMSQGQHPLIALSITISATLIALLYETLWSA